MKQKINVTVMSVCDINICANAVIPNNIAVNKHSTRSILASVLSVLSFIEFFFRHVQSVLH